MSILKYGDWLEKLYVEQNATQKLLCVIGNVLVLILVFWHELNKNQVIATLAPLGKIVSE